VKSCVCVNRRGGSRWQKGAGQGGDRVDVQVPWCSQLAKQVAFVRLPKAKAVLARLAQANLES
jgi:hypothetical protein